MNNSKHKEKIKHFLSYVGIEDIVRAYVMRSREKHYITLTADEKKQELARWYLSLTGQRLDLEEPRSFNEKIQWLKIFDTIDQKTVLSDKYLVRDWIEKEIGEQYLIPIYGVWENAQDIDFDLLPEKFVLKANHGSAMNLVVKDKNQLDYGKVCRMANRWMQTPYDLSGMEQQYFSIPRRIIAEEYIEQMDGNLLDYKIHCFNGEPKLIQVIGDRDFKRHSGKEAFFDLKWNRNDYMYNTYQQYEIAPEKPVCLEKMLEIAKKLSKEFIYVRVDLYMIDNTVKFGEMTFTPASGIGKWTKEEINQMVGSWIKLCI